MQRPSLPAPEGPKKPRPYADAPRLPPEPLLGPRGQDVPIATLVAGPPYEVEIGPGRGGFIQERALARPDVGIIGFEVRRKWAALVDARLAIVGLKPRARVFAEDAKDALPRLSPDACLRCVYLHFPDPWWKKRHQKRLVMEPQILDAIARLLCPGGELFIQTDVSERADQYEALVHGDSRFVAAGDSPGSARLKDNPYEAQSPRERRAVLDGLPINRLRFRRSG
jgi:tRNA (guanine-N7-)-methyltransferase